MELVTRGGVERSVTAHALIGLGSEYRDESLSALAGSYVQNEVDVEALLTSVESRLRSLIDTMDDVVEIAKAATVAQERGERDEVQRLGVLHDEAYARHHAEMARVIRRRISRDVVRATFGVAGTGPYR